MNTNSNKDWLELQVPVTMESLLSLDKFSHIEKLSAKQDQRITAKIAKGFKSITSAGQIWLWCDVNRAAVSQIVTVPNLKKLDIFSISSPGKLRNFSFATSLEHFYCAFTDAFNTDDFKEIASCKTLKEIHLPNSTLNTLIIKHLLTLPSLRTLDLEDSNCDDDMASLISSSKTIQNLELGATSISEEGLAKICQMSQLKSLDIWATNTKQKDLTLLKKLSSLEYLSIGQGYDENSFDPKSLIGMLAQIKSLKRIWFDGIEFNSSEKKLLSEKYEKVQISYNDQIITLE